MVIIGTLHRNSAGTSASLRSNREGQHKVYGKEQVTHLIKMSLRYVVILLDSPGPRLVSTLQNFFTVLTRVPGTALGGLVNVPLN